MKKRYFIYLFLLSVFSIIAGCKTTVDNSFRINNLAAAEVILNFRGQDIKVTPGGSASVSDIPQGTYDYATSYSIPPAATNSTTEGDVSGQVIINAGTRILLIYTSKIVDGVYTLSATISNSDNQTTTSP